MIWTGPLTIQDYILTNSVFLNLARDGKNKWWRTLLVILSMIVGQVVGTLGFELYYYTSMASRPITELQEIGKRGDISFFSEILVIFLATLLCFWISFQFLHKRKAASTIFAGRKFNWKLYFQGFFCYALILIPLIVITEQKSISDFVTGFTLAKFIPLLVLGFVTFGIQSFTEEVLFRGYVFQMINLNKISLGWVIFIESLIFGLLHLPSGYNSFVNATLIGIVFSFITIWHNRIEFASGAHNANNLLIALIIGDIGKSMSEPFDPNFKGIDILTSFITMIILGYIGYKLGNRGKLANLID